MTLHAALGEAAHACKSVFLGPRGNRSNQLHMQEVVRLLGENAHFWLGVGLADQEVCANLGRLAECCPNLCKLWAKQPYYGKLHNFHWEYWLAELHNSGAQQAARQYCPISRGKAGFPPEMRNFLGELLSLQLDQVRVINLWGECIKLWLIGCLCARKTLKLVYLTKQDKVLWKAGREAPKRS